MRFSPPSANSFSIGPSIYNLKRTFFSHRGITLAMVIIFLTGVISYKNLSDWISRENDVRDSLETIGAFEEILSILKDTQIGARGFILANESAYLTPYYNGITAFNRKLENLLKLTENDPQATALIYAIEQLAENLFAHYHHMISLHKSTSIHEIKAAIQSDRGEILMGKIREIVNEMKLQENNRYMEKYNQARQTAQISRAFLIFFDFAAMSLLFFSMVILQKEKKARDRTEKKLVRNEAELRKNQVALIAQQNTLEQSVENRTRELSASYEQLKVTLREREALLSEVHHRVKNNFQVIASLIKLSQERSKNKEAMMLLATAHSRIHAMSLIHEQLYTRERFDEIDMKDHVRTLINHLSSLYGNSEAIEVRIEGQAFRLDVSKAVPCSLVLNELISNAYKYAFTNRSRGRLDVGLSTPSPRIVAMTVKDDGVGLPPDLDEESTGTLGFTLIRGIVRHQLKGNLSIERNGGTQVRLEFPVTGRNLHHEQAIDCR